MSRRTSTPSRGDARSTRLNSSTMSRTLAVTLSPQHGPISAMRARSPGGIGGRAVTAEARGKNARWLPSSTALSPSATANLNVDDIEQIGHIDRDLLFDT